jgi:hypothetical protein
MRQKRASVRLSERRLQLLYTYDTCRKQLTVLAAYMRFYCSLLKPGGGTHPFKGGMKVRTC